MGGGFGGYCAVDNTIVGVLYIRDEDSMAVVADEEVMNIRHVYYRAAFITVLVTYVEFYCHSCCRIFRGVHFPGGGSRAGLRIRIDTGGVRR
jgi:hypothetical protein